MIPTIVAKNFKIILRSPFTVILLILAPILLMFIVGYTYSGITFNDVNLGVITSDSEFLPEIYGVEYQYFEPENLNSCLEKLKVSNLDLCVVIKLKKTPEGEFFGANIDYYIDNTRPTLSDMLYRNLERVVDERSNEYSTKTVSNIFSKANESLEFMRNASELVNGVKENLTFAIDQIESFNNYLETNDASYKSNLNKIDTIANSLKGDISNFITERDGLKSELLYGNDVIENFKEEFFFFEDEYDNNVQDLKDYATAYPGINSYVNVNSFVSMGNNFDSISSTINTIDEGFSRVSREISGMESPEGLEESISEFIPYLDKNEERYEELKIFANNLHKDLIEKEKFITKLSIELDEKIAYFEKLSETDANKVTNPIEKSYNTLFNNFKRVHQLAPMVVVLVVLFVGLLLSNVIVSIEVNSKAYFRNLIAPVSYGKFVFSLFLTALLLILFELLFLFIVLESFFSINIMANLLPLLIVITHLLVIFILLGIILGFMFSSMQISVLVTTFLMLFLFLISDMIVPIQIMPKIVGEMITANPVIIGEQLIRKIFFFDVFYLSVSDFYLIYLYIFILVLLSIWVVKRRIRNSF
jgi:ABC-type multidrug transport system permease subunit